MQPTDAATSRQVVVARAGGYDRLEIHERPRPRAGPGEVRIGARAIGVNYADCVVRMGLYASAKQYVGWPITPGFEVAGPITEVGASVESARVGEPAMAVTRFGGYASDVVVPAHQVFPVPTGWTELEAAAFPTVFLTAHYALSRLAHAAAGDSILVHSAAGGVGGALVQLAKAAGCRVVGVVGSAAKIAVARDLGADLVIDKSTCALDEALREAQPGGFDVVLDANGVSTLALSYRMLRPTGRLVVYGFHSMLPRRGGRPSWPRLALDWLRTPRFDPMRLTGENRSVLGFNLSYLFERADLLEAGMRALMDHVASGHVRPPAVTAFPLDRVADAHRALESGTTTGKLVLVP